jgi:3-oxoacyl-[acyl-carrier-protein] synthase-1
MNMGRRVVITGFGIYSCIGQDIDTVRDSLYYGKSGIVLSQERLDYGYKSGLTGILPKPELKGKLDRRERICLAQEGEFAYLSTIQALEMSHLDADYLRDNVVGIIFGNDSSASAIVESQKIMNEKHDTQLVGSAFVFQSMNSTVSMNLSTIFKLKGINFSIGAACASSTHAIGIATTLIRDGMQDVIICGGAQEVNLYSVLNFDSLGVFSNYKGDPTKASRPFDKNRDGLVPSGGAATLILEEYDHAIKRGAKIYGEILGYGFSSTGDKITKPGHDGTEIAISQALKNADITVADVDYINAHATSTVLGDAAEAIALTNIFGDRMPYVSSTKSITGHECWMAGASEVVYSLIMMHNDFVAPNINFESPDQYSAKLNLATETKSAKINTVLSNSFGFGGTNAVLVLRK